MMLRANDGPLRPQRFAMLLCAALCASPAMAAQCRLSEKPWLEGRTAGRPAARSLDARLGEEIEVFLVLPGTLDGKPVVFSEDARPGRVSWQRAGCGPLAVTWHRVEPLMQHLHTPAPNGEMKIYANAVVFGQRHGAWIGYDRLEYVQTPLPAAAGPVLRVRDARPSDAAGVPDRDAVHAPLGVMRLAATVQAGDQDRATPGAEDAPAGQISERVFRYTYRSGDDFLGWLGTFFNLPYLFGSAGQGPRSQPERYVGADCADVLVAALHRAGVHKGLQYTSVTGLADALKRVGGPTVVRPCPQQGPCPAGEEPVLRMGQQVRPGDLLAIDYIGVTDLPRGWDHIGVLVEDRGPGGAPDGVLGPEDLLAESGDQHGLKIAPLGDQGAVRVLVLRP